MLYTEKSGTSMFFNYIFLSKDSLKKGCLLLRNSENDTKAEQ